MNRISRTCTAMALAGLAFLLALPGQAGAEPGEAGAADDEPPITADTLLDDVLRCFPRDPLEIHGEMIVRQRRGVEIAHVHFTMQVDWSADPARFRYVVLDAEGEIQRELELQLRAGGRPVLTDADGAMVAMDSTIESTDLTWADLSLSFLWWRGGRIVGTDRVKGRDCYLVDVPAPAWASATAGYHRVRLWIDRSVHMLLRAEGFDAADRPVRSLWVRSLQKTDGRWMIKDMEVQGEPPVQRTRLHIESVQVLTTS